MNEPFIPTPRESWVMEQNMTHARNRVAAMTDQTRKLITDGVHGDQLMDQVLDLVIAEADPADWPGTRIVEDVCVIAMLIAAVITAARE